MPNKPKILYLSDGQDQNPEVRAQLGDCYEVVEARNDFGALARLAHESFDGVFVSSSRLDDTAKIGKLLRNEEILEGMPDGIVLLDTDNTILWGNGRLRE